MKTNLKLLAGFVITVCIASHAQVAPEATGPAVARTGEKLQYAARYSQTGQFSSSLPSAQTSTVSGSLGYANGNDHVPFNMDYSGGYTWILTGPDYGSGEFHRLFLSQGVNSHQWKLLLSDDVAYLPQSPTTGFSGIPGTGEPIGGIPVTPPTSTQSILTLNTHAVTNSAMGELSYDKNNATNLSFSGSWDLLRFPNNDGLDTDALFADAMYVRHVNGRNALSGDYKFAQFTYPGLTDQFDTNAALFGIEHRWTRSMSTSLAAGPEWISNSTTSGVPSSTNVTVNASISDQLRFGAASVAYNRGVNGGSGYLIGGLYDSVTGGLSREFGVNVNLGVTGGFQRTSGLNNNGITDGTYGGAEATWHLSRTIILFANYTGTYQTTTSALPTNALNQLLQVIGFGVGYSPREARGKQ